MTIWEMSLGGAVLIAAILVLRRALLYRVPKWTFLLLWAVALGRLLLPFTLPSRFSVYTGAARAAQYFEERETPAASPEIASPVTGPGPVQEGGWTVPAVPAAPVPAPERRPVSPVTAIYLSGVSLCGLFFAAAYLRGLRRFCEAEPVRSDFLSRWQAEHPTLLPVEIKSCAAVNAPVACGLLRPVILLPENTDWSDQDQLKCVLTHEYVHIRRGDLGWKLLLAAALCVHWFNPLVWAMYLRANRDLELACDEAVVRILGLDSRKRYAYALLSAAESGFSPLCITFTTKNHMEERIRAIMKIKKTSAAAILTAAVLVASVTAMFATSRTPESVAGSVKSAAESSIAYRDIDEAKTYEEYASILEARSRIIYGEQSWTVDGAVKVFNADGSVEELPDFYDLFPSDWEPVSLPVESGKYDHGSKNLPDREKAGLYSGNVYFSEVSVDNEIYSFGSASIFERGRDIGIYPESLPENAEAFSAGFYDEDRMKGIGWASSLSEGQGIFLSDADYGVYGTRFGFLMNVPGSHEPGYGYVIVDFLDSGFIPVDIRRGEAAA